MPTIEQLETAIADAWTLLSVAYSRQETAGSDWQAAVRKWHGAWIDHEVPAASLLIDKIAQDVEAKPPIEAATYVEVGPVEELLAQPLQMSELRKTVAEAFEEKLAGNPNLIPGKYEITGISISVDSSGSLTATVLLSTPAGSVEVSDEYYRKNSPLTGGYYILNEDGSESYEPAKE